MDNSVLWSLRLGFSSKQAQKIRTGGIEQFLKQSFATKPDRSMEGLVANGPKTPGEFKALVESLKGNKAATKENTRAGAAVNMEMKCWWIDRMRQEELPLREKMALFWQNHFVATHKKCKVNYWMYNYTMLLRENAFGNFRELTKKVLYTNSMIKYLDNHTNVKDKYNENLSRELLELFTLGIGHYTEEDIKNGARGLAGLTLGDEKGQYIPDKENNEPFSYFGKQGNFKADDMVDIIFAQPTAPYRITRKLLKWFIYDNPPEDLVKYYGDYLRSKDYEIQPLLTKMFTEEFKKPNGGSKIKDPLLFMLQLVNELNIAPVASDSVALFIQSQGMDIYEQPNVKGWDGGTYWLSSHLYQKRQIVADRFCRGKTVSLSKKAIEEGSGKNITIRLDWEKKGSNKDVIEEMKRRLLFDTDKVLQDELERILPHDLDPNAEGADIAVMRAFSYIITTPEFQLI
jgi:uncharacterized protein (DUF1800 family)